MRGAVLQLARWGLLRALEAAGTPPIRSHDVSLRRPELVRIAIKPSDGVGGLLAPRRFLLDRLLVDAARAAGAEVHHEIERPRRSACGRWPHHRHRRPRPRRARARRASGHRHRRRWRPLHRGPAGRRTDPSRGPALRGDALRLLARPRVRRPAVVLVERRRRGRDPDQRWRGLRLRRPFIRALRRRVRTRRARRVSSTPPPRGAGDRRSGWLAGARRRSCTDSRAVGASCVRAGGPGGRWSETPAISRIRSRRTASPTRCAMRSCWPAPCCAGGSPTISDTRDRLSTGLFEVTDRIASFEWDFKVLRELHQQLSDEMTREVEAMTEAGRPCEMQV